MSVKVISIKCPECSAILDVEEGREEVFCTYCGNKIKVQNENEYIYRHVNDAEVYRAETDRLVRMKELELAEKRRMASENSKKTSFVLSIISIVIGILLFIIGYKKATYRYYYYNYQLKWLYIAIAVGGLCLIFFGSSILLPNPKDRQKDQNNK